MSDASDIIDAAIENAQGPRAVSKDNESLQQHSIADQLAAANAAAATDAATKPGFGWRAQRIKPVYF